MLRFERLWDDDSNLHRNLKGIILNCDDNLFPILNTTKKQFLCLDKESIFKKSPYYNLLLKNAVFILGLGVPILSTTPFEALICNTPVLLPFGQHSFLDQYSTDGTSQFYSFNSTDQFQNNVRDVLSSYHNKKSKFTCFFGSCIFHDIFLFSGCHFVFNVPINISLVLKYYLLRTL